MAQDKGKQYFAPVIIGVLTALYILGFAIVVVVMDLPGWAKALGVIPPVALAGAMVYVSIERIKEIKGGKEDDIGKY